MSREESDWWPALAHKLEELRKSPGYVETPTGVRNYIVRVDERGRAVVLRSERSGRDRTITAGMLRSAASATRHGVILRVLRGLVEPEATGWFGPFRLRTLIENCLDEEQLWPPADGQLYLVSAAAWRGEPDTKCEPLYLGGLTGRSARLTTRVGDLIADMLGFFGGGTGHHSGGQRIYEWCSTHRVHPLDLYVSWYIEPSGCKRCGEVEWHQRLAPKCNAAAPPACREHGPTPRQLWERVWGSAGTSDHDELLDAPDPALERASRRG